jgi:hypothetical protein
MRRREFIELFGGTAALAVLLGGAAFAQQMMPGINLHSDSRPLTPEEEAKRKAVDDAYRSTLQKLPEKKKSADPWDNMRSTTTTSSRPRQP